METVDFSEVIAACDLKVGRSRQLIEFMKVCEYSSTFLDLGQRPFYFYSQTPTPAFVGPVIINFHTDLNYLFDIKNIH